MDERNMRNSDFVREKIKEKPVNKKKIAYHMIYMAVSGLVFGVFALLIFFAGYSIIRSHTIEEDAYSQNEFGLIPSQVIPQENPSDLKGMEGDTDEIFGLSITDYQNTQYNLFNVGTVCNKTIVTVTGVTSNTDIFNNSFESQGIGSGIIIKDTGTELLILTQRKTVRKASEIRVTFIDGYECTAKLKGEDVNTGLAVVAANKGMLSTDTQSKIAVAAFSEYGVSRPGTFVIAVGSPGGSNYSILTGSITSATNVVSTMDHNFSAISTDIVAPDQCFGVLVNTSGEVVGVIQQNLRTDGSDSTISAVSWAGIRPVINKMCDGIPIPYIGLATSTVTQHIADTYGMPMGVYVREVAMDSPGMAAGIQSGDVIIKINNVPISSDSGFSSQLLTKKVGDRVPIIVKRKGANGYLSISFDVELGELTK